VLELLWLLEATIAGYPEQGNLLETITTGPCFQADELPDVPDELRKPPGTSPEGASLFGDL
jgi:hypothetical protein